MCTDTVGILQCIPIQSLKSRNMIGHIFATVNWSTLYSPHSVKRLTGTITYLMLDIPGRILFGATKHIQ